MFIPACPIGPIVWLNITSASLMYFSIVILSGFEKYMSPNCMLINGNRIILIPFITGILPGNFGANTVTCAIFVSSGINSDRNLAIPSHLGRKQSVVITIFICFRCLLAYYDLSEALKKSIAFRLVRLDFSF